MKSSFAASIQASHDSKYYIVSYIVLLKNYTIPLKKTVEMLKLFLVCIEIILFDLNIEWKLKLKCINLANKCIPLS